MCLTSGILQDYKQFIMLTYRLYGEKEVLTMTLRELLTLGSISQTLKIYKGKDWRSCHDTEAEGFLPNDWLSSRVLSFDSDWDEFYIEIESV